MSTIAINIIDSTTGRPGDGISVVLERKTHSAGWQPLAERVTESKGTISDFLSIKDAFLPGHYRLIVETGLYFLAQNTQCFFPQVTVSFVVKDPLEQYHISLSISPYGYSLFRSI